MTELGPVEVALRVTALLEELGVRYVVGGSLASMVHGEARSTRDVDIVADLGPEHVEPLVGGLGKEFYADRDMIREAIELRRHFNVIHLASMYKVDLFVPPDEELHAEKWKRRQRLVLDVDPERKAWVTDPECIVLQKLAWYREGDEVSDQQWRDVLGVLKVQGDRLDLEYLRRWAVELGITDLLERARDEAG